jgi:NADPH-dependent 2,4-dienoyl-CoA reductase/sulfur reductase-like enzyme/peroxiredoxin family protein/rhodanese-related sulfurtransferase/TusA-related sulfurtransferase
MAKKVVIVGGVAGGASTAARLRRLDETMEIVILEKGEAISYANCGLPYYIGGVIEDRDDLFIQTPAGMKKRFRIDVRVKNEVISVDRENREVVVKDLSQNRTYHENYDILVLATGSYPMIPNIPGVDDQRVFTLRNIQDTDGIKQYLNQNKVNSVVVVGGGFIGLEMAENLAHAKKKVTLIEMADQVLNNLDYELAAIIHQELRDNGIDLILGEGLVAISEVPGQKSVQVITSQGKKAVADMVILALGVRPDSKLAVVAGLATGPNGAIRVDHRLQTSDPDIYAVGDVIEVPEIVSGKTNWAPLAGPANRQGRVLADILAGREASYRGAQGTAIVKVFNHIAGSTGLSEKNLKKLAIPYLASITHSSSHASYYPGAQPVTIKLLFAPESGRILGAQVIGFDGVDKRLDILATALRFEKTVEDLTELELAYAPPFSSAKDPVNIAGYTASNILKKDVEAITWDQLPEDAAGQYFLVDVREPAEAQLGKIPGAVNIPLHQLRDRLNELPKDREIVIYCQVGLRAYMGARILKQNGFMVKNLSGGYKTYGAVQKDRSQRRDNYAGSEVATAATVNYSEENREMSDTIKVNACGLQCPGPILQLFNKMQQLNDGDVLEISASDPGFANDVEAWCLRTGNTLLKLDRTPGKIAAVIRKGIQSREVSAPIIAGQDKTIIVFSADLDKAIASFIIATGAASMGRKVTMFFTFWGLNVLRKPRRVKVPKSFMDRMFGMMMPRGSTKLGLSKMNMAGMGAKMIRMTMRRKNISSLESLIGQARMMGIRLVACQMSMDVMGIKKEELLDGVEIGGVASYLAAAEEGNVNLFI